MMKCLEEILTRFNAPRRFVCSQTRILLTRLNMVKLKMVDINVHKSNYITELLVNRILNSILVPSINLSKSTKEPQGI